MFFNEIISNISLIEDEEIEFKERLNDKQSNDNSLKDIFSWLKTVCGFANHKGGTFYIGVKDSDKTLVGFDSDEIDKQKLLFSKEVNQRIHPTPLYQFTTIPYTIHDKTRYLLFIRIFESQIKPTTLTIKGVPGIYFRRDGYTNGATYEEIRLMVMNSSNYEYDKLVTNIKFNEKDFKKLFNYYKEVNNTNLTHKKLISLGFMNTEGFLLNGSLLFKDDYLGDCNIQCSLYNGITKGDDKIITINNYSGNILDSLEYAMSFVQSRMNTNYIKKPIGRVEIKAYPTRSLVEALINALAHRDYTIKNSQIQVDMFKDRLQITSPGSFYQGQEIAKTYNLSNIISKRRNDLISNILVSLKLMESAGSGFDKISEDYSNFNELHKPYIFSTSDQFTIVLPDQTYTEGVSQNISNVVYSTSPNFKPNKSDEEILKFCYYRPKTALEIANEINVSNSTYLRNNILGRLVNEELLLINKQGKESLYRTNIEKININ